MYRRGILVLCLLGPGAVFASGVRNPDTFTLAEVDEVTSLDPAYPYDNASQGLIHNVYETLIAFDGPSLTEFVPRLATEVPSRKNGGISSDGLVYRFHVRKGVRFQEGGEMTPEDVRYSLLRFMLMDRAGGPSALLLEPILGVSSTRDARGTITLDFKAAEHAIRVRGDDVVIRLARPFAPFLSIMARWSYVVPKAWAATHGDWDGREETWKDFNNPDQGRTYLHAHMNGTGPFALARWDAVQEYVLLERNEGYWRATPWLRRALVKTVPEFTTQRLMLEAGDADMIDTPRGYLEQLRVMPGVKLMEHLPRLVTDPVLFFTFHINPAGNRDIGSGRLDGDGIPPDFFTDPDVRQGFSFAFDYDSVLRDTYKGTAVRAKGPVPPGVAGYDPDQPFYSYDLKKAEEHLRKAWGGRVWAKGFRFTLTYNTGSENREAAGQILKKNLESMNPKFNVDLRGLDWGAFVDRAERRALPMFARGWWADYPDAHDFVYAFYHSQGRYALEEGYSNPEMDRLIARAVRVWDPRYREALYQKILRLGYEEAPAIFTVHPSGVLAFRDWVAGLVDNPVDLDVYFYPISKREAIHAQGH